MRFVSRWPGRDSEARQPRSKGGPDAQRQHDEAKDTTPAPRKESHWTPKHGSPQSRKDQATSRSKASKETDARGQTSGGARELHITNWRTRGPPAEGGPLEREPRTQGTTREAKRPWETGKPVTSEQEPQGWRTSREGRDGHRAPSARETPWVREGTPPEATPVPPSQPQKPRPFPRGKRGVEAEAPCLETSCSKIER